jgi:hypothetical protein
MPRPAEPAPAPALERPVKRAEADLQAIARLTYLAV